MALGLYVRAKIREKENYGQEWMEMAWVTIGIIRIEWKEGGWTTDPNVRHKYGPKLHINDYEVADKLSFFLHFFPVDYLVEEILSATTKLSFSNEFTRSPQKSFTTGAYPSKTLQ